MSYKTNRKTRNVFPTYPPPYPYSYPPPYPPPYSGPRRPSRSRKKIVKKTVTKAPEEKFFAHPQEMVNWYVETRTADGRKFNINILAYNKQHAITKTLQKFPKVEIIKLHPARVARLRRIGGRLSKGVSTAEKITRRITRFLDDPGPKYQPEEGTALEDEESGSLL